MNKDFPRIICLLRKERGLSQRQVANDLDISQALLSHYEKGIRECGLDFLVKIAVYYGVSCDYLLGRTPERNGATISVEDIPDYSENHQNDSSKSNMLAVLNKKLIINTTSIMFDLLSDLSDKKLTNAVSSYLININYYLFRKLYSANEENPQTMFAVPKNVFGGYSKALTEINNTHLDLNLKGKISDVRITPDAIEKSYPNEASSLFNLIQNAENSIKEKL
ncbi:MAG: helix-turn-helix domain-containing protein [Oscillospiraceae bacterium]|nr:helix-turn-helix domain-containing protein [Oscillospiraceae bacterium]